jgi:hypothetical protein
MSVFKPSGSSIDPKSALSASLIASVNSSLSGLASSFSFTRALRMMVRRLLNALPATVTRVASARALKTDIGDAVRVGNKTGNTVEARTCSFGLDKILGEWAVITYAHDLLQRLQRRTRALARLTESVEKGRDGLINGSVADVFLKNVKRLRSCGPYVRVFVDQACADHGYNLVLSIFSLRLGSVDTMVT